MLNQNSPVAIALKNRARSLDQKLDGAYYALQLAKGSADEQATREFYREMYMRSINAWTTYWRILGRTNAQVSASRRLLLKKIFQ